MKTLKLIFVLLMFHFTAYSQIQETWYQHNIFWAWSFPPNTSINSITTKKNLEPIICGNNGYFAKWKFPETEYWSNGGFMPITNRNLNSVFNLDSLGEIKTYFVGERGVILKSDSIYIDEWPNIYFQNSTITKNLYSVYFTENTNGIAVGDTGTIIRTTDGGSHWVQITGITLNSLYSVHFPSDNFGYAVGTNGTIIKTTDNGQNWSVKPISYNDTLRTVWFVNDNTGFIGGRDGTIFKTTDGGNNWQSQLSGTTKNINSICFMNKDTGYAAGNNKLVLKTTNGGQNWVTQLIPSGFRQGDYKCVSIPIFGLVFIVGTNGTAIGNFPDLGSISEKKKNDIFTLTPNPAGNDITISIHNGQYLPGSNLIIINMQGKNLINQNLYEQTTEINISQLPAGIYIAKLQLADGSIAQKKFVVVK